MWIKESSETCLKLHYCSWIFWYNIPRLIDKFSTGVNNTLCESCVDELQRFQIRTCLIEGRKVTLWIAVLNILGTRCRRLRLKGKINSSIYICTCTTKFMINARMKSKKVLLNVSPKAYSSLPLRNLQFLVLLILKLLLLLYMYMI